MVSLTSGTIRTHVPRSLHTAETRRTSGGAAPSARTRASDQDDRRSPGRLTVEQRHANRHSDAVRRAQAIGNKAMRTRARRKRLAAQDHGRHLARQGDPLHVTGCMLYWAEGSKRRNDVEFANSDPDMLRTFVEFLSRCYEVPRDNVRLTLNVHLNNGLALSEIEEWWLARLNFSRCSLGSHTVNRYSRRSGQTRRTLPFGTARIVVHSTFVRARHTTRPSKGHRPQGYRRYTRRAGRLAQVVERGPYKAEAAGSSPAAPIPG